MRDAARTANLLGALSTAVADRQRAAAETAAARGDSVPAALVALHMTPDGRSVDELRRIVGLTPSGGVRLVDRLVGDALAVRRPGSPDRRTVMVVLTDAGAAAARDVLAARHAALDAMLAELSDSESATFAELAAKVLGAEARARIVARRQGDVPPGGWICRLCDVTACRRDVGECPTASAASAHD